MLLVTLREHRQNRLITFRKSLKDRMPAIRLSTFDASSQMGGFSEGPTGAFVLPDFL